MQIIVQNQVIREISLENLRKYNLMDAFVSLVEDLDDAGFDVTLTTS